MFRKAFILLTIFGLIVSSCQKEDNLLTSLEDITKDEETHHHHHEDKPFKLTDEQIALQIASERKLILGKKLENPYSLENMKKAKARTQNLRNDIEITTTDFYVRFLPKDIDELNLLEQDTTLELYSYPLDYEVTERGDYYHDPTLPISAITWQYTAVSKDYNFPNVEYEIIENLFLIESAKLIYPNISEDYWDTLEDEAFRITGNLEENTGGSRAPKWNPSGRIRVQEFFTTTNNRIIGVNNVKVRARRWFTVKTDYTNSAGLYVIGSFRGSVNYDVVFETNYSQVTAWGGFQTTHGGPNQNSSWNETFNSFSNSWVRATLINAMGIYRSRAYTLGIQNPYPISYWAGGAAINRLEVRAIFGSGGGLHYWGISANDIKIWSLDANGINRSSDRLYRIMFHELGHRSHLKLVGTWDFGRSTDMLVESWASYIEWKMILNVFPPPAWWTDYPSLVSLDIQERSSTDNLFLDGYTPLFIDMIDDVSNNNQRVVWGGSSFGGVNDYPNDLVEGYNHAQLQNALDNSINIGQLRDYLVNNYNNPTENQMNTYFNFMIQFE